MSTNRRLTPAGAAGQQAGYQKRAGKIPYSHRARETAALKAKAEGRPLCPQCREPLPKGSAATLCPFCRELERRWGPRGEGG